MADEKKHDQPQTITLTLDALKALMKEQAETITKAVEARQDDRIRSGVAEILGGKAPDEQMRDYMDRARGKNIPPPPEELVPCVSPMTGSKFVARVIMSRAYPLGRIVELLDYERPVGWDAHKEDGGLYDGPKNFMLINPETGLPRIKYRQWAYQTFYMVDWNHLSGKPASILDHWRVKPATDKAAE